MPCPGKACTHSFCSMKTIWGGQRHGECTLQVWQARKSLLQSMLAQLRCGSSGSLPHRAQLVAAGNLSGADPSSLPVHAQPHVTVCRGLPTDDAKVSDRHTTRHASACARRHRKLTHGQDCSKCLHPQICRGVTASIPLFALFLQKAMSTGCEPHQAGLPCAHQTQRGSLSIAPCLSASYSSVRLFPRCTGS